MAQQIPEKQWAQVLYKNGGSVSSQYSSLIFSNLHLKPNSHLLQGSNISRFQFRSQAQMKSSLTSNFLVYATRKYPNLVIIFLLTSRLEEIFTL
jgi:hypothetical protein